jgi:hypothetical protein
MRGPGLAGFRLDVCETGACRWIGNADEMVASRAFNLPASIGRGALQRLIAVRTVEFEVLGIHKFQPDHKQKGRE